MNQSEIEHMAQGLPPSQIGKDHEEVVIWLATQLLDVQQKLDVALGKIEGLEEDRRNNLSIKMNLAAENAALKEVAKSCLQHWAAAENGSMVRLMDKCMPKLRDALNQTPATDAYLNAIRAEGVIMFATKQLAAGELDSTITLERLVLDAEDFYEQLRGSQDGE